MNSIQFALRPGSTLDEAKPDLREVDKPDPRGVDKPDPRGVGKAGNREVVRVRDSSPHFFSY